MNEVDIFSSEGGLLKSLVIVRTHKQVAWKAVDARAHTDLPTDDESVDQWQFHLGYPAGRTEELAIYASKLEYRSLVLTTCISQQSRACVHILIHTSHMIAMFALEDTQ